MKLHVLEYNVTEDYFHCKDEAGGSYRLDLLVDNSRVVKNPLDLVGRWVEIESKHPYVEIAHGVKLIESPATAAI